MKKIKKLFLLMTVVAIALVYFAVSASALSSSGKCGDNVFYTYNSTKKELVISGEGAMWDYSGYSSSPFEYSYIESVVITSGVVTIGQGAFVHCEKLKSVVIPSSVITISTDAFYACDKLEIVYYSGTQEQWKDISIGSWNSRLTYAAIRYNYCVHVDTNSDKFCDDCGSYIEKLYKTGFCGDNVTYEWYVDGMVVISGTGPMMDYETYNGSPFYDSDIKLVVINEGVTTIGNYAFYNCTNLDSVIIGDSVTIIGDYAFNIDYMSGLSNLTYIRIGESVEKIGFDTFSECFKLSNIVVDVNNQFFSSDENGVLFNKEKTTLIHYPIGNQRADYTIPNSVKTVGKYAFHDDKMVGSGYLTSVTMGDTVVTVEDFAFSGCYNLTDVNISNSVISIGDYAFSSCSNLTSVILGNNISTIEKYAFSGCTGLKSIFIPESINSIGDCAFESCDNLIDVYYGGTQLQWFNTLISVVYNDNLTGANIHYKHCLHTDKIIYYQENPTCTQIGYTEGVYCNGCNKWRSGHEEIPQIPHIFTTYTSDKNATVVSDGTKTALCDYGCGNKKTVTDKGTKLTLGTTSSVTATQTTSSLTLTWDKAPNATGYRLYYKLPGDMSWRTSVSYITATTKTFSGLPSGQAYRFAIRSAYKKADGTYILGGYKQIATATKATAPADVYSFQNSSAIRLIWTASKGATGYRIYYKSGNAWKACVSTTSSTTHTFSNLKAGSKYTFAVRPYILADGVVIWSDYITITTATQTISPVITLTSTSKGNINLSWKAVNGAEAYQVYYKVGNGNYKLYKTYTSVQSLKFANLKSGTKYTFAVRGVIKGSEENIYGFHSPVTVTVK